MKIRLTGTREEILSNINKFKQIFIIDSVSRFYPNRQKLSNYPFTGQSDIGNTYLEVKEK